MNGYNGQVRIPAAAANPFRTAGGQPEPPGQAERLRMFRAARPEWMITVDLDRDVWQAFRQRRDGSDVHVRHSLRALLDYFRAPYPGGTWQAW